MHHERGRDLAENHVDRLREFGLQIVGNDARFGLGVAVSHGETNRAALFESGSSNLLRKRNGLLQRTLAAVAFRAHHVFALFIALDGRTNIELRANRVRRGANAAALIEILERVHAEKALGSLGGTLGAGDNLRERHARVNELAHTSTAVRPAAMPMLFVSITAHCKSARPDAMLRTKS